MNKKRKPGLEEIFKKKAAPIKDRDVELTNGCKVNRALVGGTLFTLYTLIHQEEPAAAAYINFCRNQAKPLSPHNIHALYKLGLVHADGSVSPDRQQIVLNAIKGEDPDWEFVEPVANLGGQIGDVVWDVIIQRVGGNYSSGPKP